MNSWLNIQLKIEKNVRNFLFLSFKKRRRELVEKILLFFIELRNDIKPPMRKATRTIFEDTSNFGKAVVRIRLI